MRKCSICNYLRNENQFPVKDDYAVGNVCFKCFRETFGKNFVQGGDKNDK